MLKSTHLPFVIYVVCYCFAGRQQVMVGVVPMKVPYASSQSSKSVLPVVIANCKENR